MISLEELRRDPEKFKLAAIAKGEQGENNLVGVTIDKILTLDSQVRALTFTNEQLRAEQKKLSKGKPDIETLRKLQGMSQKFSEDDKALSIWRADIKNLLLTLPNPTHASVPPGLTESDNIAIRKGGQLTQFKFTPKTHVELGENLNIFDFERGVKLSGSRFTVLKSTGAKLQRALAHYMLDLAEEAGYVEVAPPFLVKREMMVGTGNLPKFEADAFKTTDDLFLIPTAEVPVTNLYRDELLSAAELPIKHMAHTPCFRSEVGSAGKDTTGFIRQHQFEKVELVKLVHPENSMEELESLVRDVEKVLHGLELPYRVLSMCEGETGFAQQKKYDLEVWAPGMDKWLEVSSCSLFGDFQARRANLRFRQDNKSKPQFVHTINGSALALARTMDAILEVHQLEDGSVKIPKALQPYLKGVELLTPTQQVNTPQITKKRPAAQLEL